MTTTIAMVTVKAVTRSDESKISKSDLAGKPKLPERVGLGIAR